MALQLIALTDPAEDPGFVPNTHRTQVPGHTTPFILAFVGT